MSKESLWSLFDETSPWCCLRMLNIGVFQSEYTKCQMEAERTNTESMIQNHLHETSSTPQSVCEMSSNLHNLKERIFCAAKDGMAITIYAMLSNKQDEEVKEVLKHETEENGQKTTPFLIAARNGYEKVVRLLLKHFKVNIEQVGTVKFDGYVIEGATGLWCAAGAGHFEVVKTLLEQGANVNHPTFSNSTPLRAACFDGRLDLVRYLIQHNADIHIPNKYNNTCLMIACYKGHKEVVSFLLEKGANPDAKAHCGATALHFSAERGYLEIVKELICHKASLLQNDQHMSPLHIAAESSRAEIVEFFVSRAECSKPDRIGALELLGASYANDKDNYDLDKAYHYMWMAMQERYADPRDMVVKDVKPAVEAYENRTECQTLQQLEAIRDEPDSIHLEALIIRERILGEDNAEIPHPIIFRGAVFADTARFDKCTSLWMRAMTLRQKNGRTITKDLLRFAQVFSQMIHVGVEVEFGPTENVLEHALEEFTRDQRNLNSESLTKEEIATQQEVYECNIHTALYLLVILTNLKYSRDEELRLCKMAYRFNRLHLKLGKTGFTPLHMAVDEHTLIDDFHVNDVVKFPNPVLTKLLVKCGGDVNVMDNNGNTPVHVIVKYTKPISDFLALHGIIMTLLENGAHLDIANSDGHTPIESSTTGVAEVILRTQSRIKLKCIAARAVKHLKVPYKGQLPTTLEEFVNIH